MLFLCYPKCSTCQKAKQWLEDHSVQYEMRDIKLNNPTTSEEECYTLLASDGMLVKRPLLIGDNFVRVGFREGQASLHP